MIYDAIIIGSGCASYSTADWLRSRGIHNIAIFTDNRCGGTSRNTGSDKQTYYKLGLDGQHPDCAFDMAKTIVSGGSADGELAYIESVNSAKCFMRLVGYGVDFVCDKFGGYVGYKTDHDDTNRATSLGPYTSKVMTEKLEEKVLGIDKTQLFDKHNIVKIIVKNNVCIGVIAYDRAKDKLVKILSKFTIVATGAPAKIYDKTVYPASQNGMTGLLIESGCKMCNFQEWQYGLASTKFRWNVSGSFMQVVPRFVSINKSGEEREFLSDYFKDIKSLSENIFLKGYEWPFCESKNSSVIDLLVAEQTEKGNKVYLDFTQNPKGFCFEGMDERAKDYLVKSNALGKNPIERLAGLNAKAIQLYLDHNIDLRKEYLEIAVCAQHNNGGVFVDNDWQTSVQNLFACGEVAGTFGVSRPGGSALNSTQVGGLRASEFIQKNLDRVVLTDNGEGDFAEERERFKNYRSGEFDIKTISVKMSKYASINREREKMQELWEEISHIKYDDISARDYVDFVKKKDNLIATKTLLNTILQAMPITGSRGSANFFVGGKKVSENLDARKFLTITEREKVSFVEAKQVPKTEFWFENIYNEKREKL